MCPICAGKTVTEDCKKELEEFKVDRGTNINKNLPLGRFLCFLPFRPLHRISKLVQYPAQSSVISLSSRLKGKIGLTMISFVQLRHARQMQRRFAQTQIPQTLVPCWLVSGIALSHYRTSWTMFISLPSRYAM